MGTAEIESYNWYKTCKIWNIINYQFEISESWQWAIPEKSKQGELRI